VTPLLVMYRTVLSAIATRPRVLALGGLGVAAVLVGLAIGLQDPFSVDRAATRYVNGLGLSVLVPVICLVFASAAFGDLNDDGTLVYLWLRPNPRWQLAVAAYAAALTVTLPLTVLPLSIGVMLAGGRAAVVGGAVGAVALGVVTYAALFCALGLRVQRALAWGLAYILIWEGFVAQAGRGASRFAIRAYTRSLLSHSSGVELALARGGVLGSTVVPLLVCVVAVAYTTSRLRRHDVP
jgi:ABC-2 type transport system permease protein